MKYAILLLLLASCRPLPEVGGAFDSQLWKADDKACKGDRARMAEDLKAAKPKLLDLTEAEVRQLLGQPDHVELFSRSQKFYLYYVKPGQQCDAPANSPLPNVRMLEVSLDALGRLHEVNIRY